MKTIHSRFLSALTILSVSAFLNGANAQTASTVPVGFMTYSLAGGGATTPMGVPLLETATFTGVNSGITSNTISVSGVSWTVNQFATPGSPFFVLITSGPQKGRTLLVTANSTNTLTLEVGDTNLDAAGFAVVANSDTIDLFQGESLGSMFGTTHTSGVLPSGLKGAALPFQADSVQIFNGVKFISYYFSTSLGYWVATGDTTNANNLVLYVDRGFLIKRLGTATTLTVLGRVPSTGLLTQLPSGGKTSVVPVRFPSDTTLAGLNFSGPGVWVSSNLPFQADRISLWNGVTWVSYYKNLSNQWLQVGGNGTDQSSVPVLSGSTILVSKQGNATGSATFFSQALPYSLN